MRITQRSVLDRYLYNLNQIRAELVSEEETLATGRRIKRPSDDPVMVPTLLRLKQAQTDTLRYQENVGQACTWLEAAEASIQDAISVVERLRGLVLTGANETLNDSARDALHAEWEVLRDELFSLANAKQSGRYLFAGSRVFTQPFDPSDPSAYAGDSLEWIHEVDENTRISANLAGDSVFSQLLQVVNELGPALQVGDPDLGGTHLEQLDAGFDALLAAQARLGARVNQLDIVEESLIGREVTLDGLRSEVEDADLSRVIIRLREAEAAYAAALQTGARLMRNTLLNYLE